MILLERFTDMNILEKKRARKGGEGRRVKGKKATGGKSMGAAGRERESGHERREQKKGA